MKYAVFIIFACIYFNKYTLTKQSIISGDQNAIALGKYFTKILAEPPTLDSDNHGFKYEENYEDERETNDNHKNRKSANKLKRKKPFCDDIRNGNMFFCRGKAFKRVPNFNYTLVKPTSHLKIDLGHNQIPILGENAFTNTRIYNILLEGNLLRTIRPIAFKKLVNLRVLWLNNNKIVRIYENAFIHNQKLIDLSLLGNQIVTLHNNVFSSNTRLKSLYLNGNQIRHITSIVFDTLTILEYLDLSFNNISIISENAFKNNTNLRFLNLQFNPLKDLPKGLFEHNLNLEDLDLKNTDIMHINFIILCPKNIKLDLRNNYYLEFANEEQLYALSEIKNVLLTNTTRFLCSCSEQLLLDTLCEYYTLRKHLWTEYFEKCFHNKTLDILPINENDTILTNQSQESNITDENTNEIKTNENIELKLNKPLSQIDTTELKQIIAQKQQRIRDSEKNIYNLNKKINELGIVALFIILVILCIILGYILYVYFSKTLKFIKN